MRGRRYSQPLGNCVWLAIPILVGSHTFLAETVRPSPATAIAAMMESPDPQNATISTMPSEAQGDLLMVNGNYVAAIEAYRQSSLRSAATWNKIGVAYHHLFALEEARKNYQMALTLNPRYPDALNNLAAVYHGERKYKKAEKTYKRALKYGPNQRIAISYCLAKAYAMAGKNEQALIYLRKAMDAGFNDRRLLMEDKEFAQLRTTPEFHQLIVAQHLD